MRDAYAMHLHSVSSRFLIEALPDALPMSVFGTLFLFDYKTALILIIFTDSPVIITDDLYQHTEPPSRLYLLFSAKYALLVLRCNPIVTIAGSISVI